MENIYTINEEEMKLIMDAICDASLHRLHLVFDPLYDDVKSDNEEWYNKYQTLAHILNNKVWGE